MSVNNLPVTWAPRRFFTQMKTCVSACMLIAMATASNAAPKGFNYDEAKVPGFDLPDPLKDVTDAKSWPARRAEILTMLEDQMFGKAPAFDKESIKVTREIPDQDLLNGTAILSQPILHLAGCEVQLPA